MRSEVDPHRWWSWFLLLGEIMYFCIDRFILLDAMMIPMSVFLCPIFCKRSQKGMSAPASGLLYPAYSCLPLRGSVSGVIVSIRTRIFRSTTNDLACFSCGWVYRARLNRLTTSKNRIAISVFSMGFWIGISQNVYLQKIEVWPWSMSFFRILSVTYVK